MTPNRQRAKKLAYDTGISALEQFALEVLNRLDALEGKSEPAPVKDVAIEPTAVTPAAAAAAKHAESRRAEFLSRK